MADSQMCSNPEPHEVHGWSEDTPMEVFKKAYHVCVGVDIVHYRRLFQNETACGLKSAYTQDLPYRPQDSKDMNQITCKDCLERMGKG